jgi:hypothetical protein
MTIRTFAICDGCGKSELDVGKVCSDWTYDHRIGDGDHRCPDCQQSALDRAVEAMRLSHSDGLEDRTNCARSALPILADELDRQTEAESRGSAYRTRESRRLREWSEQLGGQR